MINDLVLDFAKQRVLLSWLKNFETAPSRIQQAHEKLYYYCAFKVKELFVK